MWSIHPAEVSISKSQNPYCTGFRDAVLWEDLWPLRREDKRGFPCRTQALTPSLTTVIGKKNQKHFVVVYCLLALSINGLIIWIKKKWFYQQSSSLTKVSTANQCSEMSVRGPIRFCLLTVPLRFKLLVNHVIVRQSEVLKDENIWLHWSSWVSVQMELNFNQFLRKLAKNMQMDVCFHPLVGSST